MNRGRLLFAKPASSDCWNCLRPSNLGRCMATRGWTWLLGSLFSDLNLLVCRCVSPSNFSDHVYEFEPQGGQDFLAAPGSAPALHPDLRSASVHFASWGLYRGSLVPFPRALFLLNISQWKWAIGEDDIIVNIFVHEPQQFCQYGSDLGPLLFYSSV